MIRITSLVDHRRRGIAVDDYPAPTIVKMSASRSMHMTLADHDDPIAVVIMIAVIVANVFNMHWSFDDDRAGRRWSVFMVIDRETAAVTTQRTQRRHGRNNEKYSV